MINVYVTIFLMLVILVKITSGTTIGATKNIENINVRFWVMVGISSMFAVIMFYIYIKYIDDDNIDILRKIR